MPFLQINGITLPIVEIQKDFTARGERTRSGRGQIRDTRRGHRETWRVDVCRRDYDWTTAMEAYLEGQAHVFDLNDGIQASTGLQLAPGYTDLRPRPDLTGAFGNPGRFELTGTGQFACIDAQLDDLEWGLAWWENDGGGWVAYGRDWRGFGYNNGVRDDDVGALNGGTSALGVRVVNGMMVLQNNAGPTIGLDDIIVCRFAPPAEFFEAWAALTVPHGAAPMMRVSGDFHEDQTGELESYAFGEILSSDYIMGGVNTTATKGETEFVTNGKRLSFALDFVTDSFARDQVVRT